MSDNNIALQNFCNNDIYVVLFVSRNKDNKDITGFVERRKSFITTLEPDSPKLLKEFEVFFDDGVKGEMCRMYYSVNARSGIAIYKSLLHFLIDNPEYNLCSINTKLASIAAKKECAKEKKWMFDFDINNKSAVAEFCSDIKDIDQEVQSNVKKTLNGYAVITNRGFDTRKLFEKWNQNVTLKRDDLLCIHWLRDPLERCTKGGKDNDRNIRRTESETT